MLWNRWDSGSELRGLFRASSDYYAKALQKHDPKITEEKRAAILNDIGLNFLEVRDAKPAAESFEKCLKEFPNSPKKVEWTLNLGQAYAYGDKKSRENAKRVLQLLIRENPSTPAASKASKILQAIP